MSDLVITFGKHKGSTVPELLARDPAYAEWIVNQGWVAEKFAELHAAILSRGAATDDSPEHNAIQVGFLDPEFRLSVVRLIAENDIEVATARLLDDNCWGQNDRLNRCRVHLSHVISQEVICNLNAEISALEAEVSAIKSAPVAVATAVSFEQRGIDVLIKWSATLTGKYDPEPRYGSRIGVEIKPTMGDDFPSVMRQMSRLGCNVLVLGEYSGRAVPVPLLRQMFGANGITILFLRDIESK